MTATVGTTRRLEELTSTDLAEARERGWILAVPVGSTEQHGPHLPLATDTIVASELCARLASARDDVVIGPPISVGSSGEHQAFAGTLSIGSPALELVVTELCRSATETFDHVLLVSGHGGNLAALRAATARLRAESRDVLLHAPAPAGDLHAGHVETSVMLALRPDLVGSARPTGDERPFADIWPELRARGLAAVSPSGVLGDATTANAAAGLAVLDAMASDLRDAIAAWRGTG
jgi:creatinine amidohydrolase